MVRVTNLFGLAGDPDVGERLHALSHVGKVEYVILSRADMSRHRLRAVTDKGTECAIALPRSERLSNGAVLLLDALVRDFSLNLAALTAGALYRAGGLLRHNRCHVDTMGRLDQRGRIRSPAVSGGTPQTFNGDRAFAMRASQLE